MMIIDTATIPAKIAISLGLMTLRKIISSGAEIATIDIMNAKAVPMGNPFSTRAWVSGGAEGCVTAEAGRSSAKRGERLFK